MSAESLHLASATASRAGSKPGVPRRVVLAGAVGAAVAATGAVAWRTWPAAEQEVGPLPRLLTTPGWRQSFLPDSYGRDGWTYGGGVYLTNQEWLDRGRVPGTGSRWQSMAQPGSTAGRH